MADEEQVVEQESVKTATPKTYSEEEVKTLLGQAHDMGKRDMQGVKDKEIAVKDETIRRSQLLHRIDELSEEQVDGLNDHTKVSALFAAEAVKARGLTKSDERYLATLPYLSIPTEADSMAADRGTEAEGMKSDLLTQLQGSTSTGASLGSADTPSTPVGANRSSGGGQQFQSEEAAQNALSALLDKGDMEGAKKLAASIGMPIRE